MRLMARYPTKTELEFTFLEPRICCIRQNHFTKHSRGAFTLEHNILLTRTSTTTYLKSVCQQLQEITQLTTFAALINNSRQSLATRV